MIWRMPIACWIPEAINTHSEYVILIALQRQNCLCLNITFYTHCISSLFLVMYFPMYFNVIYIYIYMRVCVSLSNAVT